MTDDSVFGYPELVKGFAAARWEFALEKTI
jgi:hypothetical protein